MVCYITSVVLSSLRRVVLASGRLIAVLVEYITSVVLIGSGGEKQILSIAASRWFATSRLWCYRPCSGWFLRVVDSLLSWWNTPRLWCCLALPCGVGFRDTEAATQNPSAHPRPRGSERKILPRSELNHRIHHRIQLVFLLQGY